MSVLMAPFLTDIDPQAAVKGSRDPLSLQTIWARLGRHVVGKLTTVSTSVRDFTTLVLGYTLPNVSPTKSAEMATWRSFSDGNSWQPMQCDSS
jgi:hypothetical protein